MEKIRYKPSKYNIIKQMDANEFIAYNLISQAVAIIGPQEYDYLLTGYDATSIKVEKLVGAGFVIDELIDEKSYLKLNRSQSVYGDYNRMMYTIYTTTQCNARCSYCFENGWHKKDMTANVAKDLAKYIINNLTSEQYLYIDWFGGEPLLNVEAIRNITDEINKSEGLKERYKSKIVTNGFLLNEELIAEAKNTWNVSEMQITLDGIHDNYNKRKNYVYQKCNPFETVINNCKNVVKSGIKLGIRINVNKANIGEVESIVTYLHDQLGINKNYFIYFYPVHSNHVCSVESEVFDVSELKTIMPYTKTILFKHGYNHSPQSLRFISRKRFCGARTLNYLVVDTEGSFYKCQDYVNEFSQKVGDIHQGVVATTSLANWCSDDISEECEECKYLPVCQGGCFAARLSKERGSPCAIEINEIDTRLELMYKLIKENKND